MDFFQDARGPPGDLRKPRDDVPGRHGLAGEYAGNREKENPWEWNAQWEEMGIPGETRVGLEMEMEDDKKRGAPQRRVIQDRGVSVILPVLNLAICMHAYLGSVGLIAKGSACCTGDLVEQDIEQGDMSRYR